MGASGSLGQPDGRKGFFFEKKKVTAQVWRWPPRKASGTASGSFLKKEPKNFDKFGLSLCGKAEASLAKVFCCFFSKKQAFLPLALTAAAYLGSYKRSNKLLRKWAGPTRIGSAQVAACAQPCKYATGRSITFG
jgi:hypothetical protein